LNATVRIGGLDSMFVCKTRDLSKEGCFLDTVERLEAGVRVTVAILDKHGKEIVAVDGIIMRAPAPKADGSGRGIGVRFLDPPAAWRKLVARQERETTLPGVGPGKRPLRLRVLVVGDDARLRGALALYVTSGWDVRFATDLDGVREALAAVVVDAIIAEYDLDDPRWREALVAAQESQPGARRILRAPLQGRSPTDAGDLLHGVIDRDEGPDALLDALTLVMEQEGE
jgi:hypothetical protein